MRGSQRVTVVGGGLVGAACAYELARDGHRVTVHDRRDPGRATDAGAGILEGGSEHVLSPDPGERELARTRLRELAAATGVTMTMGIIATNPGGYEMLELIDQVAAVGGA